MSFKNGDLGLLLKLLLKAKKFVPVSREIYRLALLFSGQAFAVAADPAKLCEFLAAISQKLTFLGLMCLAIC